MGDIMIDDYTKNIENTLCKDCWLVDRPWNKHHSTPECYSSTADQLSNNLKDSWFANIFVNATLTEVEAGLSKQIWRLIP